VYLISSTVLTKFYHFCLYYANFFSIRSTLNSSKISSFLLCSNKLYPAVLLRNLICAVFCLFTSSCFVVKISQPYKSDGITKTYTFNLDWSSNKFSEFPELKKNIIF